MGDRAKILLVLLIIGGALWAFHRPPSLHPTLPLAAKGSQPARVAHGAEIDLANNLVDGKTTVFDFMSKFCGPCEGYNEPLHRLHAQRADIAVVQIDINRPGLQGIDWISPVAKEFKLQSIPYFKIYGPKGQFVAEGDDARHKVDAWIAALK